MQMRMNEIMEEKYKQIAEKIKDADGILIGASNGLSIAEGYNIFANDERFQSYFSDFQKKYGFRSLIQGSFSRFESENEMWSYYSRMAYYYMYHTQSSTLMQILYTLVKDKPYFVIRGQHERYAVCERLSQADLLQSRSSINYEGT